MLRVANHDHDRSHGVQVPMKLRNILVGAVSAVKLDSEVETWERTLCDHPQLSPLCLCIMANKFLNDVAYRISKMFAAQCPCFQTWVWK